MVEPTTGTRWIEYQPIDDIADALVNPKLHDQAGIATAIEKFNFADPAVLDERTGRLISGHGRRDALRWMRAADKPVPDGITTDGTTWLMPVVRGWSSRDDDHAHAAGLAINRHTETGGWDKTELVGLLDQLATRDPYLPTYAGYDPNDVDELKAQLAGLTERSNENPFTHNPTPGLDANGDPTSFRSNGSDAATPPAQFASFVGADIDHACPSCGYEWKGNCT